MFGATADGKITWARQLLHLLDATILVLLDRGFDAGQFLGQVAATKAQFLVRLTAARPPPVLAHMPDGSVTSLIGGVKVRIITASVTVTESGTNWGGYAASATGSGAWTGRLVCRVRPHRAGRQARRRSCRREGCGRSSPATSRRASSG